MSLDASYKNVKFISREVKMYNNWIISAEQNL